MPTRPSRRAVAFALAAALALAACGFGGRDARAPGADRTETAKPNTSSITVAAAGDIACTPERAPAPGECQQAATAALAASLGADVVIAVGDLQYERGKAEDYTASYDASWGGLKAITRPVPGNHEYTGGRAAGYFGYFGAAAHGPDGWYSFDAGGWHLVVLNSVCDAVGGCGEGSRQLQWLRDDLAANDQRCILAAWHHPRWSSGPHGSDDTFEPFWRTLAEAGADVVVSGHDHLYERFEPSGGVVQFVVGTGGRSLYPSLARAPRSAAIAASGFGVLELRLRPGGYDFAFRPVPGFEFDDRGVAAC